MYVKKIDRRGFLKIGGIAALGLAAAPILQAELPHFGNGERRISFYNTHTCEELETCYWKASRYCPDTLAEIDNILRDHRTGKIKRMDNKLLDLLFLLSRKIKTEAPFHIISGYRSPKTNQMLRRGNTGIARNSLHLHGKAIDIRLPGVPLSSLRTAAQELKAGGVGYYPKSVFVHVDTGRVRSW